MNSKRYHLIVDLTGVSGKKIEDKVELSQFLKDLAQAIDMKTLCESVVVNGVPENPGITGFVIIDYSHISVHTFSKHSEALVDVFSCKPFDKEIMVKTVLDYFDVPSENSRIQEVWWG